VKSEKYSDRGTSGIQVVAQCAVGHCCIGLALKQCLKTVVSRIGITDIFVYLTYALSRGYRGGSPTAV